MTFEQAFDELRQRCTRLASQVVGDADTAQEIAGEALARAYEHWDLLADDPSHHTAWTLRVTRNLAIDRLRRRAKTAEYEEELLVVDDSSEAELRIALHQALAALPDRQREAIALRFLVDLRQSDVARHLGVHPGTAATHIRRALASLRAALTDLETPLMKIHNLDEARALVGTDRRVRTRIVDGADHGNYHADIGIPAVFRGRGQHRRPHYGPGLVGQEIDAVVVDINADGQPVVSDALEGEVAERFTTVQDTLRAMAPGDRRRGTVRVVLSFGAFVSVDGVDGLIHISEQTEPLEAGDELDVEVLDTDVEFGRLSLRPVR